MTLKEQILGSFEKSEETPEITAKWLDAVCRLPIPAVDVEEDIDTYLDMIQSTIELEEDKNMSDMFERCFSANLIPAHV